MKNNIPLKELSICNVFNSTTQVIYEIPIYQRNYAWQKEEVETLVRDVYDAYKKNASDYYLGTLVTYHKGDELYEVIDGQQRLTTLSIVMGTLGLPMKNKLTYKARKKSDDTLGRVFDYANSEYVGGDDSLFDNLEEKDEGIVRGYKYAKECVDNLALGTELEKYKGYLLDNVKIIHYQVPRDIDLNHYFEVMNSRGEQLESHEIMKAGILGLFSSEDEKTKDIAIMINNLWEGCCNMDAYIQRSLSHTTAFDYANGTLVSNSFEDIEFNSGQNDDNQLQDVTIERLIELNGKGADGNRLSDNDQLRDKFLPLIDFPNFLLIILKVTLFMELDSFDYLSFKLDDKELLSQFEKYLKNMDDDDSKRKLAKKFVYNLVKGRYFLDNFFVHHSLGDEKKGSNPWELERRIDLNANRENTTARKWESKNLSDNRNIQEKLVQLLSMFDVTYTSKLRKNYMFYCMLYLFKQENEDIPKYADFLEKLAEKYLRDVYMNGDCLVEGRNVPGQDAFDSMIIDGEGKNVDLSIKNKSSFVDIYGNGTSVPKGIPLFVFNYLDYRIWSKYSDELKGQEYKKGSKERKIFFDDLGCSDFGDLDRFKNFYFSRSRRSLEHYYPQANVVETYDETKPWRMTSEQINCFGNFAMIGSDANSAGSNWMPYSKVDRYLDESQKINPVTVSSLKFFIMMQICSNNRRNLPEERKEESWGFNYVQEHQKKMEDILLGYHVKD